MNGRRVNPPRFRLGEGADDDDDVPDDHNGGHPEAESDREAEYNLAQQAHWSPIMPLTAAEVKPAVKEVRCPACFLYMGAFVGKAQCPSCKRWVKVDRPIDSG